MHEVKNLFVVNGSSFTTASREPHPHHPGHRVARHRLPGRRDETEALIGGRSPCSPRLSPRPPPPDRRHPGRSLRIAGEAEADLMRHVVGPRYPPVPVDREYGGFHANYARALDAPRPDDCASSLLARATSLPAEIASWARRCARTPRIRRHGVVHLEKVFWDREHGGFHDWLREIGCFERSGARSRPPTDRPSLLCPRPPPPPRRRCHRTRSRQTGLPLDRGPYRDEPRPGYLGAVARDGRRLPFDPDDVKPPLVAIATPRPTRR